MNLHSIVDQLTIKNYEYREEIAKLTAERDRYCVALESIANLKGNQFMTANQREYQMIDIADKALNPEPGMETVEVVRWQCQDCLAYVTPISTHDKHCSNCGAQKVIKLTGTYQKPAPRKIRRRKEMGNKLAMVTHFKRGHRIFAEWEE